MKDENDSFTAEIIHIGSAAASKQKAAATRQKTREKREAYCAESAARRAESSALDAQAQREAEERAARQRAADFDGVKTRMVDAEQDAKTRAQLKAENKAADLVNVAIQRNKQGMETWLPVSMVALQFQVTPRRIRALLTAGRLTGRVQENGYWEVRYPFGFKFGTRGPKIRYARPAPERRTE